MIEDYLKLVEDTKPLFSDLWTRYDTDKDLYQLKPYVMKDDKGKAVEDIINVTFNDPRTLVDFIISILNKAEMQIVVEAEKMEDKESTFIEDFFRDMLLAVDDRLFYRGIPSMFAYHAEKICVRGASALRCTLRSRNGEFVPDIIPLDPRWFVYEMGADGIAWGASLTRRTRAMLKREYGKEISTDTALVTDYWDSERNVVYADEEVMQNVPNKYGKPPFIWVPSGAGSMLQDADSLRYMGESVLAPNRGLYPELNRFASQTVTLNQMSFEGAMQYESDAGEQKVVKEYPGGRRKVTPVEKGGGFKAMPLNDIRAAGRLFYSMIYSRIQQGGLPTIDFGNLSFPLSGRMGAMLMDKDRIYLPRINALAILYQRLCLMIKEQYAKQGLKADLGETGKRVSYPTSSIDKDFSVKFKFFSTSPEEERVNYLMAAAAKGYVSDDSIRRKIIKLQDPDGEKQEMEAEQAERIHPALFMYRRAHALVDEGKLLEAKMIAERGVQLLKQMQMVGQPEEATPEPPKAPLGGSPLGSLMGGGRTGGAPGGLSEGAEMARAEREEAEE